MEVEQKDLDGWAVKFSDQGTGEFQATFSTFGVVDKQFDVTLPGAFANGSKVVIGAYGHSTVSDHSLPVGIGTIYSDHRRAWVDAQFLDTPGGRAHYETVKALGPLQEWSYTYRVTDQSTDYRDLQPWPGAKRLLKGLAVVEVSPVLKGAGVDTHTDLIKDSLDGLFWLDDDGWRRSFLEKMSSGSDDGIDADPELIAIWEQLQGARPRDLTNLRFI